LRQPEHLLRDIVVPALKIATPAMATPEATCASAAAACA
jgi:hypothetical protein